MIPHLLHVFWDGPPKPRAYAGFPDRWVDLNPGWSIIEWSSVAFRALDPSPLLLGYYERPELWSPRSNVWQWRADLARYEILNRCGGVWVDADLEPLKPIGDLIEKATGGAIIAMEDPRWCGNAFLGCEPRHPFITDVCRGLSARIQHGQRQRVNQSIGPQYVTQVVERHPEVLVLPAALIYPFSYTQMWRRDEAFPDAYAKHWWNHQASVRATGGRRDTR